MNYKIRVGNPGNHITNPLLKLTDRKYATREEACEAIYAAMYEVIDSEAGCEMIAKPADLNSRGDNYYIAKIREYYAGQTNLMGATVLDDDNPMTYDEAVRAKRELDDERYYTQSGEAGRPSYYIITESCRAWLESDDDSRFDWDRYDGRKNDDGNADALSDDYFRFACEEGERYVEAHAIEDEDDAQAADDEANNRWHDWYINKCHTYILREGYAREDGVTANVEEMR